MYGVLLLQIIIEITRCLFIIYISFFSQKKFKVQKLESQLLKVSVIIFSINRAWEKSANIWAV